MGCFARRMDGLVSKAPHGLKPDGETGARQPAQAYDLSDEGRAEHQVAYHPDASAHPLRFFMTADQVSDDTGALALLGNLPAVE